MFAFNLFLFPGSKYFGDWWLAFWISQEKQNDPTTVYNLYQDFAKKKSSNTHHEIKYYLTIYGVIAASNSVSIHSSIRPSTRPSTHPYPTHPSLHPSIYSSTHPSIIFCSCLFVYCTLLGYFFMLSTFRCWHLCVHFCLLLVGFKQPNISIKNCWIKF